MTLPHTGGCRCGAVRFEAMVDPHHVSYCHCADCRRATGSPVTAFVGFAADQVDISGPQAKAYVSGPITRSFCSACGSPIAYVDVRLQGRIYFMLGAMDRPADYRPALHAYVSEQLPYVQMADGLPRFAKTSVPRPDETTS